MLQGLQPLWPAPPRVRALSTTRLGGLSAGPYASLNLAQHVGDARDRVDANRHRLRESLALPVEPLWLEQVHGCDVAQGAGVMAGACADASVAFGPGRVCAVLTADCLPVLICNRQGTRVAAIHAGWRGLAAGVVEAALDTIDQPAEELLCWLGPAIGPESYAVGPEVRASFVGQDEAASAAFRPLDGGRHWHADLYRLARQRLARRGVRAVYGGDRCTFSEPEWFFSYRRDGVTGRMASLIWLED